MPVELTVPAAGESITEVQIGEWLKAEGAAVNKDENVVVLESEKASMELPAPVAGVLTKVLKKSGEMASVGDVIAIIEPATEARGDTKRFAAEQPAQPPPAQKAAEVKKPEPAPVAPPVIPPPSAQPVSKPPPPTKPAVSAGGREEEVVPMTLLRRTVAQNLLEARQTMAILTTFNEIDMSAVIALRKEFQEDFTARHGIKLGFMSFFVRAAVEALKAFPVVNASVRGNDIVYHKYYDIGIAIGSGRGLVVPVLRHAEHLGFAAIEKAIADYANRAQANTLKPDELQGGTFTITNGGIYGSMLSTPIISPPQSAILGLHAIQERPIASAGQVVIRSMMYVALSYDHRIIDGREAVTFLRRIKELIENPARMLLEV